MIRASIYFIFGMFRSTFLGIHRFYVIIYTYILVLCLRMMFWWLLWDFRPIDPHLSACWPTMEVSQVLCPWSKRKAEDFRSNKYHSLSVVSLTDRGEPVITNLFIFLCCAIEDAWFECLKGVFLVEGKRTIIILPLLSHSSLLS